MLVTHKDLNELLDFLGYIHRKRGVCAGFSGMWVQAALAKDEATFYDRLNLLAKYKNNFPRLKDEIYQVKEKVRNKIALKPEEKGLLDILSFFEGIVLYLYPRNYPSFFNQSYVNQLDFKTIFSIAKPIRLENKNVFRILNKNYLFDKTSLTQYLEDLAKLLSEKHVPLPIRIENSNHSLCLKYSYQEQCWHYIDTNNFKKFPESKKYYQKLNTELLVENIFASFKDSSYVVFNMTIYTTSTDNKLKAQFKDFDLRYPITQELATRVDSQNVGLLYSACQNGQLNLVRELFEKQADVNLANKEGFTPLYIACQNGYLNIVKELLKYKANIDLAAQHGPNPLLIACKRGHLEIVRELLENKADINVAVYGFFPIHVACYHGHLHVVRELLKNKGAINLANKDGDTPLHIACKQGQLDVIKELLDKGASLVHVNNQNQTALDSALLQNNHAAINLLQLKKGYKETAGIVMNASTNSKSNLNTVVPEIRKYMQKPEVFIKTQKQLSGAPILTANAPSFKSSFFNLNTDVQTQKKINADVFSPKTRLHQDTKMEIAPKLL